MEFGQDTFTELTKAEKLQLLANEVRNNPTARGAIAYALEIIADAMGGAPCEDCGAKAQAVAETTKQAAAQWHR
jgi:hypothetical protein